MPQMSGFGICGDAAADAFGGAADNNAAVDNAADDDGAVRMTIEEWTLNGRRGAQQTMISSRSAQQEPKKRLGRDAPTNTKVQ
jgi:hypothetical protein